MLDRCACNGVVLRVFVSFFVCLFVSLFLSFFLCIFLVRSAGVIRQKLNACCVFMHVCEKGVEDDT